jgi:hypothetical protein
MPKPSSDSTRIARALSEAESRIRELEGRADFNHVIAERVKSIFYAAEKDVPFILFGELSHQLEQFKPPIKRKV